MAESLTIARPYAKALFDLAIAQNTQAAWSEVLSVLTAICQSLQQQKILDNPSISAEQKQTVCLEILQKIVPNAMASLAKLVENFLHLLLQNKRMVEMASIEAIFLALVSEHAQRVEAKVVSAFVMSDVQKKQLEAALSARFNAEVLVTYQEDKSLIGGAVIYAGDWVMDGSVKGKLARLKDAILV